MWTVALALAGCADVFLPPMDAAARGASRADASTLAVNEILADPGLTGDANCDGVPSVTEDEFVEIVNLSDAPVDLSGGTLSDAVGVRHVFPAGSVLAPSGALVVFGGGAPSASCTGSAAVLQVASTHQLGLSNSGDRVLLAAADGAVVADLTFGGEGNHDQSLVRDPELTGAFVQHWSVASVPFTPGTTIDGMPFDGDDAPPDSDPTTEGCEGSSCDACAEAGYLEGTDGLTGDALIAALHDLTSAQSCASYTGATDFMFLELDGGDGTVECAYTGRVVSVAGGRPANEDMNTEHTWPQSQGARTNPAKCDLHHLYPVDSDTNSIRSSWPFGEVVTDTRAVDGGSRVGHDAEGLMVFEPRDAHKGNVARSMMYFAMRYGFDVDARALAVYRSWSAADPPDAAEIARTQQIAAVQGAENPYVVCPWLVDR